ncbi:class I SAM-dependent methyltransferase [Ramlibacter sp. MAHUQ-53]|uniref:class I SAM-dependent methyltransferase n=1 Tax=unclassified Ramlibacter TaxID=2617605 RepID=UPI00363F79A4
MPIALPASVPDALASLARRLLRRPQARAAPPAPPARPPKARWQPPPDDGRVRLNLGCGDKLLPGYINIDAAPSRKGRAPDVVADLRALAFGPGVADEILAVHVIEHFHPWEAEDLVRHWRDLLKPGGRLVLECPNLLAAARALLEEPSRAARAQGKDGQLAMWPLYGDPGWRDPLMCHRWGYTPETLADLLARCGLRHVRQEPAVFKQREPRDMRVAGEK